MNDHGTSARAVFAIGSIVYAISEAVLPSADISKHNNHSIVQLAQAQIASTSVGNASIDNAGNGSVLYTSGDMPLYFSGSGGLGCGYGDGGEGRHHHKGFGSHGGNYDRDMTTIPTVFIEHRNALKMQESIITRKQKKFDTYLGLYI